MYDKKNMNEDFFQKNNIQNKLNFEYKLEFLKNELLDSNKCQEFSKKLCEYIKNSQKN